MRTSISPQLNRLILASSLGFAGCQCPPVRATATCTTTVPATPSSTVHDPGTDPPDGVKGCSVCVTDFRNEAAPEAHTFAIEPDPNSTMKSVAISEVVIYFDANRTRANRYRPRDPEHPVYAETPPNSLHQRLMIHGEPAEKSLEGLAGVYDVFINLKEPGSAAIYERHCAQLVVGATAQRIPLSNPSCSPGAHVDR